MDNEQEKARLIELLGIPISKVQFSNFFCEIYYREELVGYLPITQSASGIHYETRSPHLKKINWSKVCYLNALELTDAVSSSLGRRIFKIVPSSLHRLFIEDANNNLFASFRCHFRNGAWELTDEKILRHDDGEHFSPFADNVFSQPEG